MGGESNFLAEDIENGDAGHAGIHNATNDQVNYLTQLVSPAGRLSEDALGGDGLPSHVLAKAANFTAAAGDLIRCNTAGGGFTITLPTAPATGALVAVKKTSADTNTLTIAAAGGGTIDGDATAVTVTENAGVIVQHVGANVWLVVASMSTTGPAGTDGVDAVLSTVQEEGSSVTQRSTMNFVGDGVSVTDAGGKTVVTIPGGGGGGGGGGLLPRKHISGRYVSGTPGVLTALNIDDGYEFAYPFEIFESTTLTHLCLNVATLDGTSVIRLGVREDDDGLPGTLVAGAATIDASTGTGSTGNKDAAFAQTLDAGVYWMVCRSVGGTPNVQGMNNLPVVISSTSQAGAMTNNPSGYNNGGGGSGALPSSWGSTYAQQVNVPRVVMKIA